MALLGWESPPRRSTPEPFAQALVASSNSAAGDVWITYQLTQAQSAKTPPHPVRTDSAPYVISPHRTALYGREANTRYNFDSLSGIQTPVAFRSTMMHGGDDSLTQLGLFNSSSRKQEFELLDGSGTWTPPRHDTPSPDTGVAPCDQEVSKRDTKFWMCIIALMMASFLIVLDLSGLSTALPDIVNDLHGTEFEWIGSSYALASTAFLPLSGGLAQVFGRKSVLLTQIFLFALGSALCGASTNMNFLIGGRTIQGIGAGGIASLTQIVISDLVPLQERGTFNGLIALAYGLGTAMSPVLAGALAQKGAWRYFFYMNLPIAAATTLMIIFFLDVRVPRMSLKEKLMSLDWIGNALVIASTTCIVLALTWGGVRYDWSSAKVLVPLILGLVSLGLFICYEFYIPQFPVLPFQVLSSRTGIAGYVQAFFGNFFQFATVYYIPLYFQACKGASPLMSGVDVLALACGIMPFAMAAGISIAKTGNYRPQLWASWCFLMLAAGLLSTIKAESAIGEVVGFELLMSVGLGILQTSPFFPILAPIDVSLNANALAFFMFVRFFSQTWGIAIGGTVIQNSLKKKLPESLIAQLPKGTSIVYSLVELIPSLDESLRPAVRDAFAESLQTFWKVLIGVAAMGFVASWFMEALPLHTSLDRRFALQDRQGGGEIPIRKDMESVNSSVERMSPPRSQSRLSYLPTSD